MDYRYSAWRGVLAVCGRQLADSHWRPGSSLQNREAAIKLVDTSFYWPCYWDRLFPRCPRQGAQCIFLGRTDYRTYLDDERLLPRDWPYREEDGGRQKYLNQEAEQDETQQHLSAALFTCFSVVLTSTP